MELNVFKPDTSTTFSHNLRDSRTSESHKNISQSWFEQMMPLADLKQTVDDEAFLKRDDIIEQDKIRVESDLTALGFPFTKNGLISLNTFTSIPNSMLEYLVSREYKADYAGYLNVELDKREISARASKSFLVRFREIEGVDHIRLIASDKYGIVDNDEVLKAVLMALPGGKSDTRCTSYFHNGDDLVANIILPDYIQSKPDSAYSCGISVGNSEVKTKSFTVRPYLYRQASNSSFIWAKRDSAININIKHFGKMDFERIRSLVSSGVETALTQGENILKVLEFAKFIPISDPLRVIASLSRDYKLTIQQGRNWHKTYLDGDYQNTVFGLINALSMSSNIYDGETGESIQVVVMQMLTNSLTITSEQLQKRWSNIDSKSWLLEPKIVDQYSSSNV